jgi:hypothetical protein
MLPPDDTSKHDRYGILLPCTTETFADFVSGLLGTAQTIERRFYGTFALTAAEVENTFHLVRQRVEQQNEASLIEFRVSTPLPTLFSSFVRIFRPGELTSAHSASRYMSIA